MTAIQREILRALRHGPLNQFEIAEVIDEPPFRVRAELQGLKRDRLVTSRRGRAELEWAPTDQGLDVAWGEYWGERQEGLFR
jgi:predicted transcriptional regulator